MYDKKQFDHVCSDTTQGGALSALGYMRKNLRDSAAFDLSSHAVYLLNSHSSSTSMVHIYKIQLFDGWSTKKHSRVIFSDKRLLSAGEHRVVDHRAGPQNFCSVRDEKGFDPGTRAMAPQVFSFGHHFKPSLRAHIYIMHECMNLCVCAMCARCMCVCAIVCIRICFINIFMQHFPNAMGCSMASSQHLFKRSENYPVKYYVTTPTFVCPRDLPFHAFA